jgi:hypothetical protein
MVTLSEAIAGTQAARTQLQTEKENISKARQQISSLRVPARTTIWQTRNKGVALSGKVEAGVLQTRKIKAQAEGEIGQAEAQLNIFEGQIKEQEAQIQEVQKQEAQAQAEEANYKMGYEAAINNEFIWFEKNPKVLEGYRAGRAARRYGKAKAENLKQTNELKKLGLKIEYGGLVDVKNKQTVVLEQLPKDTLKALEKVGIVSLSNIPQAAGYDTLGQGYSSMPARDLAVDERTGKPFGEVRGLTTSESVLYKVKQSKAYKTFKTGFEPFGVLASGFGAYGALATGWAFDPFFNAGRNAEDTSLKAKITRGGLMFGKTATVFTNPVTGTAGGVYFASKALQEVSKDPADFIFGTGKYIVQEPYEFAGGLAGLKAGPKVWDASRTITKTALPKENLIPADVLSGKNRFPLSSKDPNIQLKLFLEKSQRLPEQTDPFGFHASPQPLKNLIVEGSESEFPGLYVSYGVSPNFLKINKASFSAIKNSFKTNIFESMLSRWSKPSVAAIENLDFVVGKKGKPGQAFLPGVKTEVEAVVAPGTELIPTGSNYYFKYNGRRVPIMQFKATRGKGKSGATKAENILGSYYLPSKSSSSVRASEVLGIKSRAYSKSSSRSRVSRSSIIYSSNSRSVSSRLSSSKLSPSSKSPSKPSPFKSSLSISTPSQPKLSLTYKSTPPPSTPSRIVPGIPKTPIIKTPFKFKPKIKKIKAKKVKVKILGASKYSPSLGASILKLTATTKPSKIGGAYFAGFRPIVLRTRKTIK